METGAVVWLTLVTVLGLVLIVYPRQFADWVAKAPAWMYPLNTWLRAHPRALVIVYRVQGAILLLIVCTIVLAHFFGFLK